MPSEKVKMEVLNLLEIAWENYHYAIEKSEYFSVLEREYGMTCLSFSGN